MRGGKVQQMYDDMVYNGRFIWNRLKAEANQRKHGILFEHAAEVFDDPFFVENMMKNIRRMKIGMP